MRIATVCNDYAPTVGGVQTAVRQLAGNAKRLGHEVIVLTARPNSDVPANEVLDDVTVRRFSWQRRFLWRAPATLCAMRRVLREFRPDVVYVHFLTINALYVLWLHWLAPFKLVVSARGNDVQGMAQHSGFQRWMLRRLFRRADAILFCSSYLQQQAAPLVTGVKPATFVGVVGDGFDPDEFSGRTPYPPKNPYVLAMGRLVEKKGFDLLIRAFARLVVEFPGVHLIIVGDGEERRRLEELVDDLRMRTRIHITGFADRENTIALMMACEFFVLSSRIEPFGIVVLEALAAGKPVLATRSGGVVDLIEPGVNGLVVDADVDSLAAGLQQMLAKPPPAPVPPAGRTWAAVTEQLLDVLNRACR